MKKIDLRDRALAAEEGEYVLGLDDTGSHACYMIYGTLKPGEKDRPVKPGHGHEEIVLAVKGDLRLYGASESTLKEGEAFHIVDETTVYLQNPADTEAVYIISGGHSADGHHHH